MGVMVVVGVSSASAAALRAYKDTADTTEGDMVVVGGSVGVISASPKTRGSRAPSMES